MKTRPGQISNAPNRAHISKRFKIDCTQKSPAHRARRSKKGWARLSRGDWNTKLTQKCNKGVERPISGARAAWVLPNTHPAPSPSPTRHPPPPDPNVIARNCSTQYTPTPRTRMYARTYLCLRIIQSEMQMFTCTCSVSVSLARSATCVSFSLATLP